MQKLASLKIDNELVEKAMEILGTKTKRATVIAALERVVRADKEWQRILQKSQAESQRIRELAQAKKSLTTKYVKTESFPKPVKKKPLSPEEKEKYKQAIAAAEGCLRGTGFNTEAYLKQKQEDIEIEERKMVRWRVKNDKLCS